ncbi:322_t:CDS:2, partial [Gigaspora rosea]
MEIQAHYQTFAYNVLIILIIFSINANTQDYNFTPVPTFTYNEDNFTGKLLVKNIDSFPDGTVIVRIMNEMNDNQKIYYDQILLLRIIHPNGSVTEINNKYDIPDYNFNAGNNPNPLDVYPLFDKYILVVYSTALDWKNNETYRDRGMIIDWNGNNISDIEFGESYVDDDYNVGLIPNQARFEVNSDRTKGFLRFSQYKHSNDAVWNQYFVNSTGHLNMTGLGIISNFYKILATTNDSYDQNYEIFSATNNDYVIVYLNTTVTNISTPFEIHGKINAMFIRHNQNISYGPITLYETKEDMLLKYIYCFINIANIGNTCKIIVLANNTNYFCNIQFLSSGSVLDFSSFPVNNISENGYEVVSLPFGDYVIIDRLNDSNSTFNLALFNGKGETLSSIQIKSSFHGVHTVDALPNNTIFFTNPDTENSSWGIFGYHIPYVDVTGFHNLLIDSSFPNSNTTLNIRNTTNLFITYNHQIMKSSHNLLIYQIDQTDTNIKILRQNYSGVSRYCSITDDFTISCKILSSTFNVFNSTYHIIVENGFVKDSKYQEQLRGITDNLWVVHTESTRQNDEYVDSVTGHLRLSEIGTGRFKELNSSEQQKNIKILNEELAKNIPIDPTRLKFSGRFEFGSNGRVLLELSINAQVPNNSSQPNVNHIMEDLNALIRNKSITNLSNLFLDIDENYRFKSRSNLFGEIKYFIIGLLALIPFYFLVSYLHKKARNQKKCLYLREFSPVKSCPHELECLSKFKCYNIQKDEFKNVFSQNN